MFPQAGKLSSVMPKETVRPVAVEIVSAGPRQRGAEGFQGQTEGRRLLAPRQFAIAAQLEFATVVV